MTSQDATSGALLARSDLDALVAELDASRLDLHARYRQLQLSVARRSQAMRRQRLASSRKKNEAATAALEALFAAHGADARILQAEQVARCQARQDRQDPPPRPAPLARCLDIPNGPPLPSTGDTDMPT